MTFLCDTKITKDDLEIVFQNYFKTRAKLEKVEATVISKDLGFVSDVMRVDLTWDAEMDLPTRVVVKVPKIDDLEKFLDKMGSPKLTHNPVLTVHNIECTAYKFLQQGNSPIPRPKVYDCMPIIDGKPGFIVMEDLSEKAGIIKNIADGVNLEQWKNVVASLADQHAWSLTTDVPWRQDVLTTEDIGFLFKDFEKTTSFGLKQIKEKYPEYFGNVKEEELKKVINTDNMLRNQAKFRTILDAVMIHGDTWVNNIMFNKNPDGSLGNTIAAFVDWQISLQGCGINDFTRFEVMCVDPQMRRDHSKEMFKFYYEQMKTKAGSKIKANFEQFEAVYKDSFMFNALFFVTIIDGMMTSIARVDEDETGWRKKRMLERAKAAYEDAAHFAGWA